MNDEEKVLNATEVTERRVEIGGFLGAVLRANDHRDHHHGRRKAMIYALGEHVWVGTMPGVPVEETDAMMKCVLALARECHMQRDLDLLHEDLAGLDAVSELEKLGSAPGHIAFQRRLALANAMLRASPAEARRESLDRWAPPEMLAEVTPTSSPDTTEGKG